MFDEDSFDLDNVLLEAGPVDRGVAPLGVDVEEIRVYDSDGNLVGTIEHTPLSCLGRD